MKKLKLYKKSTMAIVLTLCFVISSGCTNTNFLRGREEYKLNIENSKRNDVDVTYVVSQAPKLQGLRTKVKEGDISPKQFIVGDNYGVIREEKDIEKYFSVINVVGGSADEFKGNSDMSYSNCFPNDFDEKYFGFVKEKDSGDTTATLTFKVNVEGSTSKKFLTYAWINCPDQTYRRDYNLWYKPTSQSGDYSLGEVFKANGEYNHPVKFGNYEAQTEINSRVTIVQDDVYFRNYNILIFDFEKYEAENSKL